jgi:NADH-quinone oxidoreductase subunit E
MENENDKLLAVLERHEKGPHSLVPLLQDIQAEFNYLPEEMLRRVAESLGLPLSQVYSVATFYKAFSLEPKGEHVITVCLGTACHVRSAPAVVEELERILGIKSGETTRDMKFTLETVNCLGACALGPIVVMDGEYNGQMTPGKIRKAFEKRYVPSADNS